MKPVFLLAVSMLMSATTMWAEHVDSRAGELASLVTDHSVTTLSISGSVNAADLDFINSRLTRLQSLDLSDCTIEAYNGPALSWGRTVSEAKTLPEYSLMGSTVSELKLPAGLKTMADGCLAASSVVSLDVPEGVDSLGLAFCDGCAALGEVTLPQSLRNIPRLAFRNCTSLKNINLPDGLETVGDDAFNGCSRLDGLMFPSTLVSIGADAFNGTALSQVDLAECTGLKSIGDWAFGHCAQLTDVTLPRLTKTGTGIFFDCPMLSNVDVAAMPAELTPYMFKGASLASLDNLLTSGVTSIGHYALYGNSGVSEAALPSELSYIGDRAMAHMESLRSLDATKLTSTPQLGEEVFDGTAAPGVRLIATADMAPVFKTTPQWQEFDVVIGQSTGGDELKIADDKISVRHIDNTLYIEATRPLDNVTLCDLQGRIVGSAQARGQASVTLSTEPLPQGSIAIVTVMYADGSHTTIKTRF